MKTTNEQYIARYGLRYTYDEIAAELGITTDDVIQIKERIQTRRLILSHGIRINTKPLTRVLQAPYKGLNTDE